MSPGRETDTQIVLPRWHPSLEPWMETGRERPSQGKDRIPCRGSGGKTDHAGMPDGRGCRGFFQPLVDYIAYGRLPENKLEAQSIKKNKVCLLVWGAVQARF
ncbi:hypothetical protein AMTR_s04412p00001100 [Amborella trichopoda]|uniref:Uncharacterized protein n=1 Tax=Amborella trichopoda TaxID=13333 RepID=U5CKL2_AMBTC|nr:hypothetical protein AMTR_s04412p00001100 [Amborella trichopoda]